MIEFWCEECGVNWITDFRRGDVCPWCLADKYEAALQEITKDVKTDARATVIARTALELEKPW